MWYQAYIYQSLILTVNNWLCLLELQYMELLPARQLDIMQCAILANSKWQIGVGTG